MKTITDKTTFVEIIDPIRKCLDNFYTLKRTGKRSFDYEESGGYDLHCSVGAIDLIDFSQENLKREREQDRKPIDIILKVAFQLGYSRAQVTIDKNIELLYKIIDSYKTTIYSLNNKIKDLQKEDT